MVDATNKRYTALTRDDVGNVKQIVNRKDSASGELLTQADYTYDAYGNLLTQRISDGKQERNATLEYDGRYQNAFPTRLSMIVTDVDGQTTPVSTSSEYDTTTGSLISSTDAEQRTTKYRVDAIGRTIEVTQTDGTTLRADYDDINNTIKVTDELGQQRLQKWNSLGQAIENGYFSGDNYVVSQRTGYDPYGRAAWADDALGNRTRNKYDNWSRVVMTTGADGTSTAMKYDDVARTATSTDAEGYMQIATYDKWGKAIQTEEKTQLDEVLRTLGKNKYDNISGQTLEQTDGNGNVTAFRYDVMGQLRQVTSANGEQTQYSYDLAGNLLQTIDPAGNIKENTYDQLNRRIQTKDKSGNTTKSYYTPGGNLTKYVDRNGNTFTYAYDQRGNLLRKVSSDETISFAVDVVGKRTSMTDRTGTTSYQYDPATEQLTKMTYPDGLTTEFTYDLNGNQTEMKGPFGNTVYTTYDVMNRMTSVGTTKDAPDARDNYYSNGLLNSSQSLNNVSTFRTYNGLDLMKLEQDRGQDTVVWYKYSYDSNKNITKRIQNGVQDDFTYDQLDRIVTASGNNEQYTYDKQGNRLTMQSDKEVNAVTSEYQYDNRDRLTQVTTDTAKVGYQYNGDNLLVERTENGITTRYYYDDGAQIIAEAEVRNGTLELKANYIRGAKLEAIVYEDGSKAYVQSNGHGDITELRDVNGVLLNKYQYDVWGNLESKEEKVHNPFLYSGELWDDTTQLQYLRARWYDPSTGRFINEDTYEGKQADPLSLNLYTYVSNNPVRYVDPTGNYCQSINGKYGHSGGCDDLKNSSRYVPDSIVNAHVGKSYNELIKIYNKMKEKAVASAKEIQIFNLDRNMVVAAPNAGSIGPVLNAFFQMLGIAGAVSFETSTAGTKTPPKNQTFIFRNGSKTNVNLTPRVVDTKGLSMFLKPSSKQFAMTTLEAVNATGVMRAKIDNKITGHVSIRAIDPYEHQLWMASREDAKNNPYYLTLILKSILIEN